MKIHFILIMSLFCASQLYAQTHIEKLDNYTASNGRTYESGEKILLGEGSAEDGHFLYVYKAGWTAALSTANSSEKGGLSASDAGKEVKIKKIKRYKDGISSTVIFTIGVGKLTNYSLEIEKAIEACEIKDCETPEAITKLKEETLLQDSVEAGLAKTENDLTGEMIETDEIKSEDNLQDNFLEENFTEKEVEIGQDNEEKSGEDKAVLKTVSKKEKYTDYFLYSIFISFASIHYLFYRKYRVKDGRYKTGYRMPSLGMRIMMTKAFYVSLLAGILMLLFFPLIYFGLI